jgi:hypothetical protein
MSLTIQYTMGSTHTWDGVNYANAFNLLMTSTTFGLILLGIRLLVGRTQVWKPETSLQKRPAVSE